MSVDHHYKVLGIPVDSDSQTVLEAYARLIFELSRQHNETCNQVHEAYKALISLKTPAPQEEGLVVINPKTEEKFKGKAKGGDKSSLKASTSIIRRVKSHGEVTTGGQAAGWSGPVAYKPTRSGNYQYSDQALMKELSNIMKGTTNAVDHEIKSRRRKSAPTLSSRKFLDPYAFFNRHRWDSPDGTEKTKTHGAGVVAVASTQTRASTSTVVQPKKEFMKNAEKEKDRVY